MNLRSFVVHFLRVRMTVRESPFTTHGLAFSSDPNAVQCSRSSYSSCVPLRGTRWKSEELIMRKAVDYLRHKIGPKLRRGAWVAAWLILFLLLFRSTTWFDTIYSRWGIYARDP